MQVSLLAAAQYKISKSGYDSVAAHGFNSFGFGEKFPGLVDIYSSSNT